MFKVHFEADVNGLASVKRYEETILVESETPKGARDKAESYIKLQGEFENDMLIQTNDGI